MNRYHKPPPPNSRAYAGIPFDVVDREADGRKHFAVWKMWLGRCYKVEDHMVAP